VVNPYAESLTFLDDRTRTRRDHAKYLTLIDAIALLLQHQRPVKTLTRRGQTLEYIEVSLNDIALANELSHEVLGRSLDELPPQTRRVLGMIESLVESEARTRSLPRSGIHFTRRQLRARCGMSDAAVRVHLDRLVSLEYVRPVVGRNGLRFEYELLFDGDLDRSAPQMIGLIDVASLGGTAVTSQGPAGTSQGEGAGLAPGLQAARTHPAATLPGAESAENAAPAATSSAIEADASEKVVTGGGAPDVRSATRARAASSSNSSSSLAAAAACGG